MPLTCADFDGPCCDSCHTDKDMGFDDLIEVSADDGATFAVVCCMKVDAAYAARDALEQGMQGDK